MILKLEVGVNKKNEKLIKPRKLEKNNRKNWTVKKNRLKFWKNRPVRFGFISLKLKKLNQTQTERKPNRAKPVWTGFCPKKPNRTETGQFEPVSVNVFLNFGLVFFFYKNRTENDHP